MEVSVPKLRTEESLRSQRQATATARRTTVVSNVLKSASKYVNLLQFHEFSSSKFLQLIGILSVSGECIHFTLKTCQIVAGISMTPVNFTNFFEFVFWLDFGY